MSGTSDRQASPLDIHTSRRRLLEAKRELICHMVWSADLDDVVTKVQADETLRKLNDRLYLEEQYHQLLQEAERVSLPYAKACAIH